MGYTAGTTKLMVGLGMSSISDSWYSFAQNVKTVEEYQELVNKGEFPLLRGHLLTKEDLVIREHILNIMCHFTCLLPCVCVVLLVCACVLHV